LKKRRDFINDEIVLANKIKIDAFKEFNKAEKIRVRAFLDAKNIISNATNDATLLKNEMHKSAKNEVDKMIADAKYEIEKINNQNTSKINETIVNVATTISKAFLKENNNSNNKN
jgi:F0F1-type ATP synthase membrane subunit b/b'